MKVYRVENLDCPDCTLKLEEAVSRLDCVSSARFVFATAELHLDTDDYPQVEALVKKMEPQVRLVAEGTGEKKEPAQPWKRELVFLVCGTVLWALGLGAESFLPGFQFWITWTLLLPLYVFFGIPVFRQAWVNLRSGQLFDENFLMALATAAAWAIGAGTEALSVMLFYQWGEFFQDRAVARSRRSIGELLQKKPSLARIMRDGQILETVPEQVRTDELVEVRPGERFPLDGVLVTGNLQADTSSLTGESLPRDLGPGDEVLAGYVNLNALAVVRVSRPYRESVYAAIVHSVDAALEKKAPLEKFITRFARIYTPLVIALAAGFFGLLALTGTPVQTALYRSLVMLMVSCPCALVISIPLTYLAAMGRSSRLGILIKDAAALERLPRIDTVLWDKTGTLTNGRPLYTGLMTALGAGEEALESCLTAGLTRSTHPLSGAYLRARHPEVGESAENLTETAGQGVSFLWKGRKAFLGRKTYLEEQGISVGSDPVLTCVHAAWDGSYLGCAVFEDLPKAGALEAVHDLRRQGIVHQEVLSGDKVPAVERVAEPLGLKAQGGLLPQGKVDRLENHRGNGRRVLFVGDGLNDAPVMAAADVGVSLGAAASGAALETSDVAILDDSPRKVAALVALGRKTRSVVVQNILLALVIKGAFLALGGLGLATMAEAVFADAGTALLAVLNSLRVVGKTEGQK